MAYQVEYNSVDLTEDEDSRDTITDVTENLQQSYYSYKEVNGNTPRLTTLSPSTPPPLTPICEINSLRGQLGNHQRTVPKLKKIRSTSSNQEEQTTLSDEVSAVQPENKSVTFNNDYSAFHKFGGYPSSVSPCKTSIGKEWTIKKGGKTYKIVIPYNVMPTLNQSNGSVVVNVPEVGPIMLKINPCFKDPTVPELEPFSLNFDEIMEATVEPAPQDLHVESLLGESISDPERYIDLLYDPRFCWIQPKSKNYAYSFKCNFFGFSKTDMQKARRCLRNFTLSTKKLENIFAGKKSESGKKLSKSSNKIKASVKMKEINSHLINSAFCQTQSNLKQNCWISSDIDNMDIEDVLTPNVVINTDNNYDVAIQEHITRTSKIHSNIGATKKKVTQVDLKHCFIRLVKDNCIENLIRIGGINKFFNDSKINSKKTSKSKSSTEISLKILKSKFINDEVKFKSQISFLKPLLLISDHSVENVLDTSDFYKSNIVYTINKGYFSNKILENDNFVGAVKRGFIKLVDCDLIIRYLMGEIGPISC